MSKTKPTDKELLEKKTTYYIIQITWSMSLVLPYEETQKLLEALRYAEQYTTSFTVPHPKIDGETKSCSAIIPIEDNPIQLTLISREEYLRLKMIAAMGIYIPTRKEQD